MPTPPFLSVVCLRLQHALRSALQGLLQEAGVPNAAAWLAQQHPEQQQQRQQMVPHPRFARVNTLKAPVADVLEQLATEAAGAQSTRGAAGAASSKRTQQGRQAGPVVDELLPDVLVFPPGTDLHDHPLVQQGVLVLQVSETRLLGSALGTLIGALEFCCHADAITVSRKACGGWVLSNQYVAGCSANGCEEDGKFGCDFAWVEGVMCLQLLCSAACLQHCRPVSRSPRILGACDN